MLTVIAADKMVCKRICDVFGRKVRARTLFVHEQARNLVLFCPDRIVRSNRNQSRINGFVEFLEPRLATPENRKLCDSPSAEQTELRFANFRRLYSRLSPLVGFLFDRSRSSRICIHFDPMTSHHRSVLLPDGIRNDQVGGLHRHVATNAVCNNCFFQLGELSAVLRSMTLQAVARKRSSVSLYLMDVMTGRANQLGGSLVTPAHL